MVSKEIKGLKMTLFTKNEMIDFQDRFYNYCSGDMQEFKNELVSSEYNDEEIEFICRNIEVQNEN